jgi:streptogramin lyase
VSIVASPAVIPAPVSEFTLPHLASEPNGITRGPDGNLWFVESAQQSLDRVARIGRITPAGVLTEFSTGISVNAQPAQIVTGPDGSLWFTETSDRIGRITTGGVVTEFSAGITPGSEPFGIAVGPDGNLWFAEIGGIGRITPAGVVTEFKTGITAGTQPLEIIAGADGNLWFTEQFGGIGRITTAGVITEFTAGLTTPRSTLEGITTGPDGNIWFAEDVGRIGRITPAGVITEFSAGITPDSQPADITAGPDGNLWFAEASAKQIGRITTAGVVTEFPGGSAPGSAPTGITAGPDGNIWFTEFDGNSVARLAMPGTAASATSTALSASLNPVITGQSVTFTVTVIPRVPGAAAGTPTGTVTFMDGNTVLGTVALGAGGKAFLTTSFATEGMHAVQAIYNGDDTFTGSSRTLAEQVNANLAAGNTIVIRRDADGTHADVTINGVLQLVPTTTSFDSMSLAFNGGVGNDSFTIDLSNGNPLPARDMTIDGAGGNDVLTIIGSPGDDTVVASAVGVTIDNTVISLANVQALRFPGGSGGSDQLEMLGGTWHVDADAPVAAPSKVAVTVGAGTTAMFDGSQHLASLTISDGVVKSLAPAGAVLSVGPLTISGGGRLDLGASDVLTTTAPGTVRALLISARTADNDWSGPGITSSLVAVNPNKFAIGYAHAGDESNPIDTLAPGTTLVRPTLAGDVNLDGKVDFLDIAQLFSTRFNSGGTSAGYTDGDLDYSGAVDFFDLTVVLSGNYQTGETFGTAVARAARAAAPSAAVASASTATGGASPKTRGRPDGALLFSTSLIEPRAAGTSVAGDVGNFGNGRLHAFNAATGRFVTRLKNSDSKPIQIDGLWALQVGNGSAGTDANTVYFTAGPRHETHGLFGTLTASVT